jgi:hypothetical protein
VGSPRLSQSVAVRRIRRTQTARSLFSIPRASPLTVGRTKHGGSLSLRICGELLRSAIRCRVCCSRSQRHCLLRYICNSSTETDFRSSFGLDLDPTFDSRSWIGRHRVSQWISFCPSLCRRCGELRDPVCRTHILIRRSIVFATARSPIAFGSMIQNLLCRRNIGLLALPNLQSRLLDGAGKRKRQGPRHSRLESDIHGIQTG